MRKAAEIRPSGPWTAPEGAARDALEAAEASGEAPQPPALPLPASGLSGRLASLAETAKAYARSAQADNTRRAYAADWKMFASWLRRQGLSETPPDPGGGRALPRRASRARRRRAFGRHPRAAAVGHRLALPPARPAARHPRPAYRHRARRHPPPARPPSPAEGRHLRRRASGHAGDAGHGSEGPARPGHSGDRLRRRPAPIRDRRPGLRARIRPRTAQVGSKSFPKAPSSPSAARPAGARSRSAGARAPTPARSRCSRPGCGSGGSPAGPCSGPWRARTAGSDPSG